MWRIKDAGKHGHVVRSAVHSLKWCRNPGQAATGAGSGVTLEDQTEHHMEVIKNLAARIQSWPTPPHQRPPVAWVWRRCGLFRPPCRPPGCDQPRCSLPQRPYPLLRWERLGHGRCLHLGLTTTTPATQSCVQQVKQVLYTSLSF